MHQREVVVLAVYLLGGQTKSIDTEDVAMKAHHLAPGRFSWRKHPEQINLELVRVYLSDAKKEVYGRLLEGTGKKGWRLTHEGTRWCEANSESASDLGHWERSDSKGGSIDEQRWRRERKRLLTSDAWREWSEKGAITRKSAFEFLRLDSYADATIRDRKLSRIWQLFRDDGEVRPFLEGVVRSTREEEGPDD